MERDQHHDRFSATAVVRVEDRVARRGAEHRGASTVGARSRAGRTLTGRDLTWTDWNARWWDRQGVYGGLVAGGVFVVVAAVWTLLMRDDFGILWPLRLAASLIFGQTALELDAPFGTTVVTGALVHLLVSAVSGLVFGTLLAGRGRWRRSLSALVSVGGIYGVVIWLINVYAIAPAYGLTWVPEATHPVAYFLAHTVGFGIPLALYLYWAAAPRRRLGIE